MGRKSKKRNKERQEKQERMFDVEEDMNMSDMTETRRNAKELSKLKKKERKKRLRQMMLMKGDRKSQEPGSSKTGWYKLVIKGDSPLEREFVLSSIANIIDLEFHPRGFCRIDNSSCFYLENNEQAANAIAGLDRRLQGPDGCRLKIVSNKCDGPDLILNSDQLQVLRQCLSGRYKEDVRLLDLSDLHNDPLLKERDILTPLQTPSIMKQVLKLVKENIPDLKALNLSNNKLRRSDLQLLNSLQSGPSQLTALNLEHNNICDLKVLNFIKMFPLTELSLQFNPVVESFKDRPVSYIREVRGRLSSLQLLDSIDIDTYLAENDNKPSSHKVNINFSKNEKIMCSSSSSSNSEFKVTDETVRMFLDQYYALVDTPERTNLVAAYTPDAVLEVKSNLDSIVNNVFVGHDKIREALLMLPATQHQHSSFSLHIQPLGPKTTRAEVTGQCQVSGVVAPVAFLRIMTIVPFNTGFCCSQDKLELKMTVA